MQDGYGRAFRKGLGKGGRKGNGRGGQKESDKGDGKGKDAFMSARCSVWGYNISRQSEAQPLQR